MYDKYIYIYMHVGYTYVYIYTYIYVLICMFIHMDPNTFREGTCPPKTYPNTA